MTTDELEDVVDEEMYTDTSMFDADEIVRSVEEVARQRRADPDAEKRLTARQRFEMMMEKRRLAENLEDELSDDWPDVDEL
ncbi:MAG: hypothetical protein HKN49_02405 [Gammaproteobacteria bacterium]|nr:hypothetical protein [Gammaproteobacteria bacterium]